MKTLILVRHAKSSWDDPMLDDVDRPLNDRGKRDAPRMGKRLKEKDLHPQLMLTSHARRAYSTCKRIAEVLGYAKDRIKTDQRLYHAGEEQLLHVVQALPERHDVVMIFGHNPGMTDFANMLLIKEKPIKNIPTCGVVAVRFDAERWPDAATSNASFIFFDFPKSRQD